jgi:hypothetical protein
MRTFSDYAENDSGNHEVRAMTYVPENKALLLPALRLLLFLLFLLSLLLLLLLRTDNPQIIT